MAAKQWWNDQQQRGDQARQNVPQVSRQEARQQVFNRPQAPQQNVNYGEMPIVQAVKQRSIRPMIDQFKNPGKLMANVAQGLTNDAMSGGFGGGFGATIKKTTPIMRDLAEEAKYQVYNGFRKLSSNIDNKIATGGLNEAMGLENRRLMASNTLKALEKRKQTMPQINRLRETLASEGIDTGHQVNFPDKIDDFMEGDSVLYNGEKYKFVKNYGVRGDSRIIEDSFGRQTPVLPSQISKVSEAKGVDSYGMSHRPSETGATADNISLGGDLMPDDVYQHPEWYFGVNNTDDYGKATRESWNTIRKIRGKPDSDITIYRASPSSELNQGDWITLSRKYAQLHAKGDMKINKFKVKAKDIQFAGDDINEFGYYPLK